MELSGIDGAAAKWDKAVEIARRAEELGYDSIWVYDHFHNVPAAGARGGVRVLDDHHRDQSTDHPHPPRSDGRLQQLPTPYGAGEDHVDRRCGLRRLSDFYRKMKSALVSHSVANAWGEGAKEE